MPIYAYCGNNPLYYTDPSGLDPVTEEEFGYLKLIAGSLAKLARSGRISDVEALAGTVEAIVKYSGSEPNDVDDFMSAFTRLLSAWIWDPVWYDAFNVRYNTEYVSNFGDEGFKKDYQEPRPRGQTLDPNDVASRNQVTHFVGYVTAGYIGPLLVADCYCYYREIRLQRGTTDGADYLLGLVAIDVGAALKRYRDQDEFGVGTFHFDLPCPLCGNTFCNGLAPNQLADWIRNNLGE